LDDGESHPSAQSPGLSYTFGELGSYFNDWQMSITSSRLALLCICIDSDFFPAQLIVWDWTTGDILLVGCMFLSWSSLMQIISQDIEHSYYSSATFVDDSGS
jgi:hypothetical protein